MKIDTDDYLTLEQVAEEIGCSLRSAYRAVDAAVSDNPSVVTVIFNKRLVLRKMLAAVQARYFPFGSERRHQLAVECGHKGGAAKARNRRRRERSQARSP